MADNFKMVGGKLYKDGTPFTGYMYGRTYTDGVVTAFGVEYNPQTGIGGGRQRIVNGVTQYETRQPDGSYKWVDVGSAGSVPLGLQGEPDVTIQFSGSGTYNSPLLADGVPYTGRRFEAYYENGLQMGYTSANPRAAAVEAFGQKNFGSASPATPTGSTVASFSGAGLPSASGLYTASDGKTFNDIQSYTNYQQKLDTQRGERQSAYDLLYQEFAQYGLGSLVTPFKSLIEQGIDVRGSEFKLRLRESDAYKKRFAANQARLAKGLSALSEAEYINLEDQYQNVMRNYGLPASYYAKGDMGVQPGFEKFISGDVSPAELEDRIQTAQNRVINAAPEVTQALKQFYPDITNGDILAYALDPEQALTTLKRKVTAAEIGGAAMAEGLATGLTRAEELQRFGVTGAAYREAAPFIKQAAERGSQLTSFYNQGQFDQTTAEQAALGISGSAEAQKKIRKLSELEAASFSGQAGRAQGALARERAGQF